MMLVVDENSSNNTTEQLKVPNNDNLTSVTLNSALSSNTTAIYCRISCSNSTNDDVTIYTDNWCLEEVS